jgi:hypothetical protein
MSNGERWHRRERKGRRGTGEELVLLRADCGERRERGGCLPERLPPIPSDGDVSKIHRNESQIKM